jgi:two-component system, LytTR family, sensor kinase
MMMPQYNGMDQKIMKAILPFGCVLTNGIILREVYFLQLQCFVMATLIALLVLGIYFCLCGWIALRFRRHFPKEKQIPLRLAVSIITFLLMSGLVLYALHLLYERIPFFQYRFNETQFAWTYFAMGICNIFLTFLMEGIAIYQSWETSRAETEKLNQAYKKSHLDGLRSQVNPHFLFNSLNSLSSLIQEDEEKAEKFLDEMSKVYRYMLRDDKQWVELHAELNFVKSYMHLLNARFGEALKLRVNIPETAQKQLVAPLSLQTVIENAFTQNIVSKAHPLHIDLYMSQPDILTIRNNIQHKTFNETLEVEASLDHLVSKYRMLKNPIVIEDSNAAYRHIHIPLITEKTATLL